MIDLADGASNKIRQLTSKQAKEQIELLTKDINEYNESYYVQNVSKISDAEYDKLTEELRQLEIQFPKYIRSDTPTKKVGSAAGGDFKKYQHTSPMLSIANVFSEDDLDDFLTRVQKFLNTVEFPEMFLEPKIDGVSFSVTYKDGILVNGATRGDGYVGEDVTENIMTIKGLPHKIENVPSFLELRGEIYIDKDDFLKLNRNQKEAKKKIFSNPRNCASGSIRQLDKLVSASRPMKYFIYGASNPLSFGITKQSELMLFLDKLGFNVNKISKLAHSKEEIINFYDEMRRARADLAYEIDGLVYKINDFQKQEELGYTAKSPRGMIAHKFPANLTQTQLLDIQTQVGRSGVLTPVAILSPVGVGGVTISRATLNNYHEIIQKDIRIGDYIILERAGDVIPKIIGVNKEKRGDNIKQFSIPSICPSCGSNVEISNEYRQVFCENFLVCKSQRYRAILHFVSKKAFNIQGFGKKQIETFLEKNIISTPVDIFSIKERYMENKINLRDLEGFGDISIQNLLTSIKNSMTINLDRFIYALGIPLIGEVGAYELADYIKTSENLLNTFCTSESIEQNVVNDLIQINGIGEKTAHKILEFFLNAKNRLTVTDLLKIITIPEHMSTQESLQDDGQVKNNKLKNEVIVFTGRLNQQSRDEAKSIAKRFGAKVVESVSKNVTFVVAGDDAGNKLKQAQKMEIKIISEDEWIDIVNES